MSLSRERVRPVFVFAVTLYSSRFTAVKEVTQSSVFFRAGVNKEFVSIDGAGRPNRDRADHPYRDSTDNPDRDRNHPGPHE